MTTPRNSSDVTEGSGASRVSAAVGRGRRQWSARWGWVQRLRPVRTYLHFSDVGGVVLSGGMSYQALFAVFAALWLGFGVFGITLRSRPELLDSVIEQINLFIPGLVGEDGVGVVPITELMSARTLDWASAIAGAVLLWVALNWFTGTRRSIRIIFGLEVRQYRNPVLLKLRDFVLAIIFFLAILVSAALAVLSSNLADQFFTWIGAGADNWLLGTLGTLARFGAVYVFDVILLLAMHRYLAEVRVPRWRLIAGCALGALVLLALKIVGGVAIGGTTSNPLLATFAVFVGLLIWFNLICRTLLLTSSWIATGLDHELGLPPEGFPAHSADV
ncbi:YihY/virulence factor BrkB family protein [Leucobacter japonicus]|uniref:YihY/virulence factor BrkB family protein n=1 Tax=Leucobacter japonicus TaxID=1461259 RepID=UPI0006A76A36|nr:YihY/virulence factor BrkB family protein [Leucobacter japonicus]